MGWGLNPLDDIAQIGHDVASGAGKALDWSEKPYNFLSHTLSTPFTFFDHEAYLADTGHSAPLSDLFSAEKWSEAWKNAAQVSPGQAITMGVNSVFTGAKATFNPISYQEAGRLEPDPYNHAAVQHFFQTNSLANLGSGATDAFYHIYGDPANLVGEGVIKDARMYTKGKLTPTSVMDRVVAHPSTQRFIQSVPDMSFQQLMEHPILRASSNRYNAAALLSMAKNSQQAEQMFRIGIGDEKAYRDLMSDRSAVGQLQERMGGLSDETSLPQPEPVIPGQLSLYDDLVKNRVAQLVNNAAVDLKSNFLNMNPVDLAEFEAQSGKATVDYAQRMIDDDANMLRMADDMYSSLRNRTKAGPLSTAWGTARANLSIRAARSGLSPFSSSVYEPSTVSTVLRGMSVDPMVRLYQVLHEPYAGKFIDFRRDDSVNGVKAMLNTHPALAEDDKADMLLRYARASRADRQKVFNDIEQEAVSKTADAYGVDAETASDLYHTTAERRNIFLEKAKSRAYGILKRSGGEELGAALPVSDTGQVMLNPNYTSQLAAGAVPAYDGRTLDLALRRMDANGVSRALASLGDRGRSITTELLDKTYGVWKPMVLVTGHRAYNHVGDDAIRSIAVAGAHTTALNAKEGTANFVRNAISKVTKNQQMRTITGQHETRLKDLKAVADGMAQRLAAQKQAAKDGLPVPPGISVSEADVSASRKAYRDAVAKGIPGLPEKRRLYQGEFTVPGTSIRLSDLFGGPDGQTNRNIFGSSQTFDQTYNEQASSIFDHIKMVGDHDLIGPSHGTQVHAEALLRYVKNHMSSSPVVRQLVDGKSDNEIRDWMLNTPKGQAYRKDLHIGEPMQNIDNIKDDVVRYLPTDAAKEAAVTGKYRMADIERTWPAASERPTVIGNLGLLNYGGAIEHKYVKSITQKLIKITGEVPDDVFVRHPLAGSLYRGNVTDLIRTRIAQGHPDTFTPEELEVARKSAIRTTRKQMQDLLYDSSTFTSMGHTVRFISPFFNAWHNAMSKWTNLIANDPSLVLRGYQAKRALWGNPATIDTTTGEPATQDTPLDNLAIVTHMPQGLANKLGLGEMNSIPINMSKIISPTYMDSIGSPGWGPIVVAPVNHLAKNVPAVLDNPLVQNILGGRITSNDLQAFIPSTAAEGLDALNLAGVTGQPDNVGSRATLAWSIWQEQMYDYMNGKRGTPPSWNDVNKQASWLSFMDAAANRFLPLGFSPSPSHKALIDEYRQMENQDPKNAQQNFYDKYGAAGFAFTQSLSQNPSGIPATPGALASYKRHEGLIKQFPELGALVVGPEGNGNFSDLAFQWEKANGLRTYMTPEQAADMEQQNLGWARYNRVIHNLGYQLQARGLTSINQPGAKDLKAAVDQWVQTTGDPSSPIYNPQFYSSFTSYNPDKYQMRIQAIEKIVNDPEMMNDKGAQAGGYLRGLVMYFDARDRARQLLSQRRSQNINAKSNADIKASMESEVDLISQDSTYFQGLYQRYLKNDTLKTP